MATLTAYEQQRLNNIKRNRELISNLGIQHSASKPTRTRPPPSKRRRLDLNSAPTRSSSRIANADTKASYKEDVLALPTRELTARATPKRKSANPVPPTPAIAAPVKSSVSAEELADIRSGWTSWTATAPPPTRDPVTGVFHFGSDATFLPNKSPEEVLREGCFGGSYFRPLFSKRLGVTIEDDWRELPASWTAGLDVGKYLTSSEYDPEVNKYGVACGQSIEEWEASGWIDHRHDVRGWFQWYCRYFMGRRCEDDERQISRWRKCVGETGRWRRILLKKYVANGVRTVWDDGEDEVSDSKRVSPVVHQTCLHWAFEVRQGVLDDFWDSGA